jgi:hypothetical protein
MLSQSSAASQTPVAGRQAPVLFASADTCPWCRCSSPPGRRRRPSPAHGARRQERVGGAGDAAAVAGLGDIAGTRRRPRSSNGCRTKDASESLPVACAVSKAARHFR